MGGRNQNDMPSSSENAKRDNSLRLLYIATGLVILVWLIYLACPPLHFPFLSEMLRPFLPHAFFTDGKHINLSVIGDYFGALNCLFAGLAYAAVVVSIKQQSKTIEQQCKSIEHQGKSIEHQGKSIEQQGKSIEQQSKSLEQQSKSLEQQGQSLEQQSQSITIQQEELKAQLAEIANRAKEAKEQNDLQRKFQLSNEFYRRLSLLKTTEQDIIYSNKHGIAAMIALAKRLDDIICKIQTNESLAARDDWKDHKQDIESALDLFSIWGQCFLSLAHDVYNHIASQAKHEIANLPNTDKEYKRNKKTELLKEAKESIQHYHTVLINSSVWAGHYLLLLLYSTTDSDFKLNRLKRNPMFASKQIAGHAREERYQYLFQRLYHIEHDDNDPTSFQNIYEDYISLIKSPALPPSPPPARKQTTTVRQKSSKPQIAKRRSKK